jgi:hypothetical protein
VLLRRLYGGLALLLVPWSAATSPVGPALLTDLGNQVWYVTFVSHLALFLSLVGRWHEAQIKDAQGPQNGS